MRVDYLLSKRQSQPLELPSTAELVLNTRDFAHRNQGDPPKERQIAAGNALFDTLEKL